MDDKKILYMYKEEGKREFAFNLLVQSYSERLYWHIRSLTLDHEDANDLLQSTLIKAWNNLPTFRGDSKLYTWLYKIATNETLTFLKKKQLSSFLSLSSYDSILESKLEGDTHFNGDKMQLALQKAILKLPPTQRAIFNFRYFQELPYEEISQILGTSVGALKASYHHAYKKIKKEMEDLFLD